MDKQRLVLAGLTMMGRRLGRRQREPLAVFAAQLGILGATAAPTESPLAFLYPNVLHPEQTQRRRRRRQRSEPVASTSSVLLPTSRAASTSAGSEDPVTTLPDIYAPGADGLWRKTSGVAESCSVSTTPSWLLP